MAKPKRAVEDLDAELAALEAELAALEGRKPAAKPAAKPKPAAASAPLATPASPEPPAQGEPAKKKGFAFGRKQEAPAAAPPAPPGEAAPAKKGFGLKLPKLKPQAAETPAAPAPAPAAAAPAPVATPVAAPSVAPPPRAPAIPVTDPRPWRRDGDAWVRALPAERPIVRRILDENDAVVREEPATQRDVDEVTGVKAERGVGRLFGRWGK